MMNRGILIAGGATLALVMLERRARGGELGAFAGKANTAAAAYLEAHGAITFSVPSSGSMVEAYESMLSALGPSGAATSDYVAIRQMWLGAYAAGAAADPVNYILVGNPDEANPVFDNLEAATDPAYFCTGKTPIGEVAPWLDPDQTDADHVVAATGTPLGKAICRLYALSSWGSTSSLEVLAAVRDVAAAMDAADYRASGNRRSDHQPAPWRLSDLFDFLPSLPDFGGLAINLAMIAVGGFVIWKVATK